MCCPNEAGEISVPAGTWCCPGQVRADPSSSWRLSLEWSCSSLISAQSVEKEVRGGLSINKKINQNPDQLEVFPFFYSILMLINCCVPVEIFPVLST